MLIQLSSAQGPVECQRAVALALRRLQDEATALGVRTTIVEAQTGEREGTWRSVLLDLDGEQAQVLASRWMGTVQWTCVSPYRPKHLRKNWFVGVTRCETPVSVFDGEVRVEAMRARGPGGQHVNKTSSAIRATHMASGVSVRVETERSQHANRKLALALLGWKLNEQAQSKAAQAKGQRRLHHFSVERGNPVRSFQGETFVERMV